MAPPRRRAKRLAWTLAGAVSILLFGLVAAVANAVAGGRARRAKAARPE